MDSYLVNKYNQAAPRYTSYPPANHFSDDFNADDYLNLIDDSNSGNPQNIAIYIHIPFCQQICYYCGCNALKLNKDSNIDEYISAIKKEISIVLGKVNKDRKISQIHFGGGTPNAIESHYLKDIIATITEGFEFIDQHEIAIECHPALLSYEYIDELISIGFNRFSLGIQDFDKEVLKSVNRLPSALPVNDLVKYLRKQLPSVGINLDFIYGLPLQTAESFSKSIEKAIDIQPDRLVTFSYAHVPWLKKHQQILQKQGLPNSEDKMAIFQRATELMMKAGYTTIGFDHFAKPEDELSVALNSKALHRNFQGYCTRRTTGQVYAFGVSAISQLNGGYAQNTKSTTEYIASINNNILPIEKGLSVSDEQAIIRELINQLMCNQHIHWDSLAEQVNTTPEQIKSIVNYQPKALQDMADDGLLIFDEEHIETTELGNTFIRNIAVLFDPMYKQSDNLYSKTV
jgi:oxygen-independent coproporphyrinogen-3 oxidase